MTKALKDALKKQKKQSKQEVLQIPGSLGIPIGGQRRTEVPNRNSFVYVRLRDNQNEVIQAFNNKVAPSYGLPVLVERQNGRYIIVSVDTLRYNNNYNSFASFLPRHGNTHSFDFESGGGGDITWVYPRQFMPALIMPSGSTGAPNAVLNAYTLRNADGTWKYVGITGTPNLTPYNPNTGTQARMVLVYLDSLSGNPYLLAGSTYFASTITGASSIVPYIPALTDPNAIPLAAVRLVSGTNVISWDNIYEARQFIHVVPTGTGGGSGGTGSFDGTYLRLDTSNDPLTGQLDIIPASGIQGLNISTLDDTASFTVYQRGTGSVGSIAGNVFSLTREPYGNSAVSFDGTIMQLQQNPSSSGTMTGPAMTVISGATERFRLNPNAKGTGSLAFIDGDNTLSDNGNLLLLKNHGTSKTKVAAQGNLEFGVAVSKESNAGKIGYELFDSGYLNIVGAGTAGGNRRTKMYDKLWVSDQLQVNNVLYVDNTISKVSITGSASVTDGFYWDGWQKMTDSWSRTGNYTFTVSGDVTAIYRKGAKVRYKDGGSYEYGVIQSSSFAAGTTTVTLITNTDYAMAAATITNTYLSYIENPEGFPDWFNYSSTLGGFSGTPTQIARFRIAGHAVMVFLDISGTSNSANFTATMPVTIQNFKNQFIGGFRAMDNSAVITATVPACVLSAGSTTITFYKDWGATGWTASGTKEAQITTTIEF